MVRLILEVVVKVNCIVDYLCDLVSILVWIERNEKCAVVDKLTTEILDVFLENSKVHDKYVLIRFCYNNAKLVIFSKKQS